MAARAYRAFNETDRAALRKRQEEIDEYLYDANAVLDVATVLEYKFPRQMSTLWDLANTDRTAPDARCSAPPQQPQPRLDGRRELIP